MHDVERTANLLGAAALVVTDLTLAGVTSGTGVSASGAAALVVLRAGSPLSVTELGRRVGLTQSAAARMVDGLEGRGLLRREPGVGRTVSVRLTEAGTRAAEETSRIRGDLLRDALAALEPAQRDGLGSALDVLLARLYRTVADADLMCRLCDRECCTRDAVCPVGAAERQAEPQAARRVERRAELQADRRADRQMERGAERRAERGAERQTESGAERQTERGAARRAERQTERRADRQTERGAERRADRQTEHGAERRAELQTERGAERRAGE